MGIKKRIFVLASVAVISLNSLFAQESSYSFVRKEADRQQLVQHFAWAGDEFASQYEILVQKEERGTWRDEVRRITTDNFIELTLSPGRYRVRITAFDLLKRRRPNLDWVNFEVREAHQPEISDFSPSGFYLDEDTTWELQLSGRNFTESSEIYLREPGSIGNRINPTSVKRNADGESALLNFNPSLLRTGTYEVYVRNPGGLDTHMGPFRVAYRKPLDITVQIGYTPIIPLYGSLYDVTFNDKIYPVGAYARLGIIPIKRTWGYLGIELTPLWSKQTSVHDEYNVDAQLPGIRMTFLFQKWFPNRVMVINIRLGAGLLRLTQMAYTFGSFKTEAFASYYVSGEAGASFQWMFWRRLFIDIGIDFTHIFTPADTRPDGLFRPAVGVGWQF